MDVRNDSFFCPSVCFGNISFGAFFMSLWERNKDFMGKRSKRMDGKGDSQPFRLFFLAWIHEKEEGGDFFIKHAHRFLAGNDDACFGLAVATLGLGPSTPYLSTIQQTQRQICLLYSRWDWMDNWDEFTQTFTTFYGWEKERRKGEKERRLSHPHLPMTRTRKKGE